MCLGWKSELAIAKKESEVLANHTTPRGSTEGLLVSVSIRRSLPEPSALGTVAKASNALY